MAASPLDSMTVASPCAASWEEMAGDDRVRFCRVCQLNVYNLSAMSWSEAETLLAEKEGRLCRRFYRRPDGKVLTSDCPIGLQDSPRRRHFIIAGLLTGLLVVFAVIFLACGNAPRESAYAQLRQVEPFKKVFDWLDPPPPPALPPGAILGW